MIQKLQKVIIGVLLTVFLAIGFSTPVYAQSVESVKPIGYLYRVNVSSWQKATDFYGDILGMMQDGDKNDCDQPADPTKTCWLEFFTPGKDMDDVRIGTWVSSTQGTGRGVITIVVKNIEDARAYLVSRKVDVSVIREVGKKVRLAFFTDFDGNSLAIRDENGPM
ncbi:MAG: VOC family protein [Nostochopsis sp.]